MAALSVFLEQDVSNRKQFCSLNYEFEAGGDQASRQQSHAMNNLNAAPTQAYLRVRSLAHSGGVL